MGGLGLSLRLSQAKTLSILVAAAMRVQRVSQANIGRMMEGAVKHQIKRCWRFCANQRVETADAMRGIVAQFLAKRGKSKKKLLIAVDWCSTNRQIECSIYTIGLIMLEKIDVSPPEAFTAVVELSELAAPNWG